MVFTVPLGRAISGVITFFAVAALFAMLGTYWRVLLVAVVVSLVVGLLWQRAENRRRRAPGTTEYRIDRAHQVAYQHELAVQTEMGTSAKEARHAAGAAGRTAAADMRAQIEAEAATQAIQNRKDAEQAIRNRAQPE